MSARFGTRAESQPQGGGAGAGKNIGHLWSIQLPNQLSLEGEGLPRASGTSSQKAQTCCHSP